MTGPPPKPASSARPPSRARLPRGRWLALALACLAALGAAGYFGLHRYRVGQYWHAAQRALAAYDYPLARSNLEKCVELDPDNAEWRFALARACRRGDDLTAWRQSLREAAQR